MIPRLLACALGLAALAVGGLRVSLVERTGERVLAGGVTLGPVEVGETVPLKFRVRAGTEQARIETVALSGADFQTVALPTLPLTLAPGAYLDVEAECRPSRSGSSSGVLTVNAETWLVVVNAKPAALLMTEDGFSLAPGEEIHFGPVDLGSQVSRRFRLENPSPERVLISRLELVGTGFHAALPETPFELGSAAGVDLDVVFEPQSEGRLGASLYINSREFLLRGDGVAPPVPKPSLVFDPPNLRSGLQAKAIVRLAGPVTWPANGVLRMQFTGAQDPAVRLLSGNGQTLDFRLPLGADTGQFGGAAFAEFQTGTTAGRLTFTVEVGTHREELSVDLAPAPVYLDTAQATRSSTSLDVRFAGFDNTRTASVLGFTFYDSAGRLIGAAPIRVDAGTSFRGYFDASTVGGLFSVRAVFAVRGKWDQIASVEIEALNSQGSARRSVKMTE